MNPFIHTNYRYIGNKNLKRQTEEKCYFSTNILTKFMNIL